MLDPSSFDLVETVSFLRFAAIDHVVVEEVVVSGAFPDLGMHDDGRVEAGHLEAGGGPGGDFQLVLGRDHVAPPGLADVSLQFDAQGAVIPKAVQSAVNLARLEQEPTPLREGDQLLHLHGISLLPDGG